MTYQLILIYIASLIGIGILLHHPSRTFGIPSLLIFMGVGLSLGNGELGFSYDNIELTSLVGGIALNIIVFVGGLNTSTNNICIAFREGGLLSTLGVLLTTFIFALLLSLILDYSFIHCLLFASIVSSTDAAAVFSILKSKKLNLKEQTGTILEFESSTNDPVALILVVLLTELALTPTHPISVAMVTFELLEQILTSLTIAYLVGKLSVWLLNHIKLEEYGLIPVFILASFVLATYGSEFAGGNILLASYVIGVVIGNGISRGKEITKYFFNSFSWLAQALMFIVLGLQIFPHQLFEVMYLSIIPAFLLILIARPLAVQICYLFFPRASWKKRAFISVIGLKGATPLVFALIPAAAGVTGSLTILNMVFFIVLISVFIQGGAIEPLAKKLNLNIH